MILRTGVLPRWLAWLGIVGAIVLLFDLAYLNIFPLWVWVFIASVVMLMRHEPTRDDRGFAPTPSRARRSGLTPGATRAHGRDPRRTEGRDGYVHAPGPGQAHRASRERFRM